MSIAKLALVNIVGDMKSLDDVIIRCLDRGDFHPEPSQQAAGGIRGFTPLSEENPYTDALQKLTDAGVAAGLNPKYMPEYVRSDKLSRVTAHSQQYYEDFYRTFSEGLSALRERMNFLQGEIDQDEAALLILSHLAELDVDFDELFSCKYIKVRLGRLPLDSYQKLSFYAGKPFIFKSFDAEKDYRWGAYFALAEDTPEIDDIFSSLYFERMRVPSFIHGTPEAALTRLREEISTNREQLEAAKKQFQELVDAQRDRYYKLYTRLKFLSDSFDMRKYVSVLKRQFIDVFYITGFVEESRADDFAKSLRQISDVSVEVKPHDSDKRLHPPTKLKNGWFSRPFEMFVEMYGLPAYGDFDPTPFVAFTYSLLFGVMFGDLGQGLVLVLGGWLLWKFKHFQIGAVVNRIGIFSCIFGTLYGSVFGFEELLTPFYTGVLGLPGKPVEVMAPENTNRILIAAVALGVLLICACILLDIFVSLHKRDYERALFSANGVAGFVFYGAVLFGAVMMFLAGKNYFTHLYVLLLIVLPLAVILFKEPLGNLLRGLSARPEEGMGSYLAVAPFELFEVVLSFFSNTMSFLRVGGFVLSHAGMMAVVFTLSEMVGSAASPAVIIIGNLFVMGMEGLIVGIQVLRLEFYEMFSRYFDGDGKPFSPVTVKGAGK